MSSPLKLKETSYFHGGMEVEEEKEALSMIIGAIVGLFYYSIFRIPFIVSMLLPFCPCIGIFIYLDSLNNN